MNMITIFLVALALSTPTIGASKTAFKEEQQNQQQVAVAPSPDAPDGLYPKTHIYFHNLLGNGITASFHARSHYWDFGLRQVADKEVAEITFHPFVVSSLTNIWCDLSTQNGTAVVWVYRYNPDFKRCYKTCHWLLLPNGIYGINKGSEADIYVPWRRTA